VTCGDQFDPVIRPKNPHLAERHVVEADGEVTCGGDPTGREAVAGVRLTLGSLLPASSVNAG
jgi:hypothetical protein